MRRIVATATAVLMLVAGCATTPPPGTLIAPGEWDAATTRTYAAPASRVYTAALLYYQPLGSIGVSDREAGLLTATIAPTPGASALGAAFGTGGMTMQWEHSVVVVGQGPDSSRVSLRISERFMRAGVQEAGKPEDVRALYTQALDGIGARLAAMPKGD